MTDETAHSDATQAVAPAVQPSRHRHGDPVRSAAELVASGSIEFSCGTREQIPLVAELLPWGTPVFVPVLPRHSLDSRIEVIGLLREAGFDPVPHLAARRIASRRALLDFLRSACAAGGVHRVLLIGGDSGEAAGPYRDALGLLRDGALQEAGIREVGLAGYPEGHPHIDARALGSALRDKIDFAAGRGFGVHVVTQFSFVPRRIIEYCAVLAREAPSVPVYVGMAGPASWRQLVHYARYCGVSASLSAVGKVGVRIAQLADHARADEQLGLLGSFTASHASTNVVGVHVFGFGGFLETSRWMGEHLRSKSIQDSKSFRR